MTLRKHIIILFLLSSLVSCKESINIEEILTNNEVLELREESKGCLFNENLTTITPNSEKYRNLIIWFQKNQNGWENSIASYAGYDISLNGGNFRLLIYENGVVLGYADKKGEVKQLTKKVNKSEFDFLLN